MGVFILEVEMQNNYWNYPYNNFNGACWYNCPMAQDCFGYSQQMPYPRYEGSFRLDEDGDIFEDQWEEEFEDQVEIDFEDDFGEQYDEDIVEDMPEETRNRRDVERVVAIIKREATNDLRELERIGINRRLLDYLITSVVTYLDRNYEKYRRGPLDQRVQAAERDIRRELPWVFDIFQVLSASPATIGRLANKVVRIALRNLRPAPPVTTPPPMPRQ